MTVVVTNNVPAKYRGFLASCMLEIAPGVYSHSRISRAVRQRIWSVFEEWHHEAPIEGSILMLWASQSESSGLGVASIGLPQRRLLDYDGILISRLASQDMDGLVIPWQKEQQGAFQ